MSFLDKLHSPGRIPREGIVKIIVIGLVIILAAMFFGGGTPVPLGIPGAGMAFNSSVTAPMAPQAFPGATKGGMAARDYDQYAMGDGGMAYDMVAMEESARMIYPDPMPPMPPIGGNAGSPDFPDERKIIRNGSLALVVEDVGKATADISGLVGRLGGWVDNQNIYEYGAGEKQGSLSLRVPSEKFLEAMTLLKQLAVRVSNENISSSDVSTQIVDLEANLKNYRVEEAQYQEIMKRSGKISEVLEVTRALAQVRGNIERTQGQLNYLERQVAMSVITVSLTPVADAKEVTDEWRPLLVVKESFRNLALHLTYLANEIIMFIIQVLPILAIKLGFLFLVIWAVLKGGKKAMRRLNGGMPS